MPNRVVMLIVFLKSLFLFFFSICWCCCRCRCRELSCAAIYECLRCLFAVSLNYSCSIRWCRMATILICLIIMCVFVCRAHTKPRICLLNGVHLNATSPHICTESNTKLCFACTKIHWRVHLLVKKRIECSMLGRVCILWCNVCDVPCAISSHIWKKRFVNYVRGTCVSGTSPCSMETKRKFSIIIRWELPSTVNREPRAAAEAIVLFFFCLPKMFPCLMIS